VLQRDSVICAGDRQAPPLRSSPIRQRTDAAPEDDHARGRRNRPDSVADIRDSAGEGDHVLEVSALGKQVFYGREFRVGSLMLGCLIV